MTIYWKETVEQPPLIIERRITAEKDDLFFKWDYIWYWYSKEMYIWVIGAEEISESLINTPWHKRFIKRLVRLYDNKIETEWNLSNPEFQLSCFFEKMKWIQKISKEEFTKELSAFQERYISPFLSNN